MENENIIRIKFVGDTRVGKTSIYKRMVGEEFLKSLPSTIRVQRNFQGNFKFKEKEYKIDFFDATIEKEYKDDCWGFLKRNPGGGYFVVFDLCKENSLNAVDSWIADIKENDPTDKIIILGNKSDETKNKINKETIDSLLAKYREENIDFIETSAKTNKNIANALQKMIDLIEGNPQGNANESSEKKDCPCFNCLK